MNGNLKNGKGVFNWGGQVNTPGEEGGINHTKDFQRATGIILFNIYLNYI